MSRRLHRATALGDPSSLPIGNRSAWWTVRSGGERRGRLRPLRTPPGVTKRGGPTWCPVRPMAGGRGEGQQETLRPRTRGPRMPFASRARVRPVGRDHPKHRCPTQRRANRCDSRHVEPACPVRHVNLWRGSGVGYLREPPRPCGLRPQPRHGRRAEYWRLFP
ncbi:hypothetical protein ATKI12_3187 [Kitasatospora sp. Ki12]